MQSLWRNAGSGAEVVRLTQSDEIEKLVRLFENVAQEQGWQPGEALRQCLERSVYFGLHIESAAKPFAGGLQLVLPDALGHLPYQEVWPEVSGAAVVRGRVQNSRTRRSSHGRTAHVAVLALEAQFRGHSTLFWQIAVEMWRHCVGTGITTLFIEVTPRVLPLYQRLGWPLYIRGERRLHWGEECYLCTLGIPEVAQAILERAENSPYYRQIVAQAFRVTLAARADDGEMDVRKKGPALTADLSLGAEPESCAA